jgi:hypothetical protein
LGGIKLLKNRGLSGEGFSWEKGSELKGMK